MTSNDSRSTRPRPNPFPHSAPAFLALVVLLLLAGPAPATAQQVSYSGVATFEEVRWDDAFGLEDARLPGLRLSLDFGPYVSLQPFYAWKDGVEIREDLASGSAEDDLFDVKAFGANMQVNLARGTVVPFLRGGGGVLRMDDVDSDRSDRILLRGGGGIRLGFGEGAGLEFSAERWNTRLTEPLVPGAISSDDFPEDGRVNSTVFGAGLRLPLGGRPAAGDEMRGILPGVSVEPYVARIDFADELRLPRQEAAGVRAGIDVNRNVGVRGVYWRGTNDDRDAWDDVEGYGAEVRFNLGGDTGLSPFLVAGVGRISFDDDFRDLDDMARTRQDHLTLGGGAALVLGNNARLEFGARNLLMTPGAELEDVTDPDELISNWQYSAGVSFTLGARGRTARERDLRDRERELDRLTDRDRSLDEALADEQARAQEEIRRLAEENRRLRAGEAPEQVERVEVRTDTITTGRTITIPVPEVGEIILRYGEAYAVPGRLPGDTAQTPVQPGLPDARLMAMIREIIREELARTDVRPDPRPARADEPTPRTEREDAFLQDGGLHAITPFTGLQSTPTQLMMGVRADVGRLGGPFPIRLLPEVSVGLGEGDTEFRVAGMGRIGWNAGLDRNVTPYGQLGISLTNQRILSVDAGYGVSFDAFKSSDRGPFNLFVEHRGVALFSENQFLVGITVRP
ncbi:MAG: hypothetical protein EA352_07565 [Gemmatimonadales bacterium]|nr:MAG: hypothetical protein EA352_07565 [Gemmatimonadales bacterium]